jgi:hypothetical protein
MRPAAALAPLVVLTAAVVGVALYALSRPTPPPRKVKLAVLVVFDQMRGDYLRQWKPHFRDDGFVRLQRDGAWFSNCHYPYAVTTTGPGHASMLTGACPDAHGIVNNNWIEKGTATYCATRDVYTLVPDPAREKKGAKPIAGGTPERLLSETVADVLKETTGGRAKVFGLSFKDRSAILPTGKRADGAYWFQNFPTDNQAGGADVYSGAFVTSTYYTEKINDTGRVHAWVKEFNDSRRATRWLGKDWTRFRPDLEYDALSGRDDQQGEGSGHAQGRTFPHPTTRKLDKQYYETLLTSPFGNDMLLELAKACVTVEKLGSRDVPDLLVVSFSSNDPIGHTWGPNSHEVLDVTLRSDAIVADLLAFLDRTVGKDQYLFAVTADHGVCPLPEVAQARGIAPFARRVNSEELQKKLDDHLTKVYPASKQADGKPAKWVEGQVFPWLYLNPRLVESVGQSRDAVAAEAAKFLVTQTDVPGVARAFTRAEVSGPVSPADEIAVRVKRSFHPARSGDVYVLLQPYCTEGKPPPLPAEPTGTMHCTPYAYDTHVPLLVYGPGIRGGERNEATTPQALASIFAKWLDVRRPKDAAFPLPETLE